MTTKTNPTSSPIASAAAVYPNFGTGPFHIHDADLRSALGAEIERLIAILDVLDGDPDLEPSLGSYDAARYEPDAEGDSADDEPSLAGTSDIDQTNWSQGAGDDSEADELGPMARATYSVLGEAQATREASARLGAIIARLCGAPAGQAVRA